MYASPVGIGNNKGIETADDVVVEQLTGGDVSGEGDSRNEDFRM
jgi:hypothetical protein